MVTRVTAPPAGKKPAPKTRAKSVEPPRPAARPKPRKKVTPPTSGQPDFADERMSKVDTAWLRMDNETHLMQIMGVW